MCSSPDAIISMQLCFISEQLICHHCFQPLTSTTLTQIHTDMGSPGYRKRLQAASLCHQEPNGDDANGHDLIRQAHHQ